MNQVDYPSTICLRTFNRDHGIRQVRINPEYNISYLRTIEGDDCIFIYKKKVLLDSMTFKFYSMNDGDIICVIPYQNDLIPKYIPKNSKLCMDLERERLKIVNQKFSKIEGYQNVSKKLTFLKDQLEGLAKLEERKPLHDNITRLPTKTQISSDPLPVFW